MTTDDELQDAGEDFIQHVGVKGMRWGHRKGKSGSTSGKKRMSKETVAKVSIIGAIIATRIIASVARNNMGMSDLEYSPPPVWTDGYVV